MRHGRNRKAQYERDYPHKADVRALAGMLGQLDIDDVSLPQLANELGFGFATTSCSEDFIALEECKADVVDLADNYQALLDALEAQNGGSVDYGVFGGQTFITGASFGGLVATQLIEGRPASVLGRFTVMPKSRWQRSAA